jgi:Tol biopolymer transport system component
VAAGSDIFALGVILYEMLGGARPFVRDTAAETMTAILREEPAALTVGGQPASPALARVVERCLEKAADERFQSARDLAFALDNATLDSGSGIRAADAQSHGVGAAQATASAPRFGRLLWPFVAVAMAASFAAGLWMQPDTPAPPTPPRVSQLTFTGADHQPSVSPDDRLIAFTSSRSGISQVWLRQVEGGGEQPLTAGPDWLPRFSPDGTSVTFIRNEDGLSSAYRVPVVGGEPRKLLDDVHEVDWAPDGQTLAFLRGAAMAERVAGTALGVFDPATGDERILVQLEGWDLLGVAWSPDGKWLATTRASTQGGAADYSLVIADPESGETQTISVANGAVLSAPAWSGADAVILASSPISVSGSPVPAAVVRVDITSSEQRLLLWQTHVFPGRGSVNSSVRMSVLGNNRLVFDTTQQSQSLERVAVDGGRYEPVTNGVSTDRQPAYSRDGSRVLFTSNRSGNVDLFSYEFATGRLLQLTEHPASDWDGAYSPDGTSIVWSSDRGGNLEIWLADADGGNPRQVSHDGVDAENPTMTPDGEWIVYSSGNPANSGIFKVRPDGSDATLLLAGNWVNPEVSPDGRYVSLVATGAARRNTVRVVDFATGQLADFGVTIDFELDMPNITYGRARWLPDGRRLAYIGVNDEGRSGVWLQDFEPGRDTTASRRPLSPFSDTNVIETFGISPDGEHVVTSALDEIRALRSVDGLPTLR